MPEKTYLTPKPGICLVDPETGNMLQSGLDVVAPDSALAKAQPGKLRSITQAELDRAKAQVAKAKTVTTDGIALGTEAPAAAPAPAPAKAAPAQASKPVAAPPESGTKA
ncbi:MAG: hypothetical protein AAFP86_10290 [Planctomycetota bacterium]